LGRAQPRFAWPRQPRERFISNSRTRVLTFGQIQNLESAAASSLLNENAGQGRVAGVSIVAAFRRPGLRLRPLDVTAGQMKLLNGHSGLIFAARTLIDQKPGIGVLVATSAQIELSEWILSSGQR
jgi:hypothetical protein